jgi:CHAT domain-containing protein
LAALPGSDISVERIGRYFTHPQTLVVAQATKNNFMEQFQGCKIIQLYTHASDSSSRGEPVIYFSDSALYLSELIPENKPATRLIVLSACETGNGKLYKGEGVYSFNRGFAAAGIPSSVINLWSVENKSSYRLTELFYKYVEKGLALDLALQKAKLEFLESASQENKLPYYWAAFIVTGKTDPIGFKENSPWPNILIAGLSVLVFLGLRYTFNTFIRSRDVNE